MLIKYERIHCMRREKGISLSCKTARFFRTVSDLGIWISSMSKSASEEPESLSLWMSHVLLRSCGKQGVGLDSVLLSEWNVGEEFNDPVLDVDSVEEYFPYVDDDSGEDDGGVPPELLNSRCTDDEKGVKFDDVDDSLMFCRLT